MISVAQRAAELKAATRRLIAAAEVQDLTPDLAGQVQVAVHQVDSLLAQVTALEGADQEVQMTTGLIAAIAALALLVVGLLVKLKRPSIPQPGPTPVPVTGGPVIAVFTQATHYTKAQLTAFLPVMQQFVDLHLAPVWGTPCHLVLTDGPLPGKWWMVFLDTADAPGALAYHDVTNDGLPLSKVFVETIRQAGASLTVAATHELAEMLVDPDINLSAEHVFGSDQTIYAYESADAVEDDADGFDIDGVRVTNFVYPDWFRDFTHPAGTKFDHLGLCTAPFQLRRGGYMPVFRNGGWTQIFGSVAKAAMHEQEDRRGHRSELRAARWAGGQLRRSEAA